MVKYFINALFTKQAHPIHRKKNIKLSFVPQVIVLFFAPSVGKQGPSERFVLTVLVNAMMLPGLSKFRIHKRQSTPEPTRVDVNLISIHDRVQGCFSEQADMPEYFKS